MTREVPRGRLPTLIALPLLLVLFAATVSVGQRMSGLQPYEVGEDVVRRGLTGDSIPYSASTRVDFSQLEALPDHAEIAGVTVEAVPSFEATYELRVNVKVTDGHYLVTLLVREAPDGWEISDLHVR